MTLYVYQTSLDGASYDTFAIDRVFWAKCFDRFETSEQIKNVWDYWSWLHIEVYPGQTETCIVNKTTKWMCFIKR